MEANRRAESITEFSQKVSDKNDEAAFLECVSDGRESIPTDVAIRYLTQLEYKVGSLEDEADRLRAENKYLNGALDKATDQREKLARRFEGLTSSEIGDLRSSLTALDDILLDIQAIKNAD